MQKPITIYTDGGCTGNPGSGGWASILLIQDEEIQLSGGEKETTNNRMELTAAIKAFEYLKVNKYSEAIEFYTDSQYLMKGMETWLENWIKRGWKNAKKEPVLNRDLWELLATHKDELDIRWHWVKGHSGNRYNEQCDQLVNEERQKFNT